MKRTPSEFGTFFEPFLGGGAVFLSLPAHLPKIGNDANAELVATYLAIRDDVDEVLSQLRRFRNTKADYLEIRAWDRSPNFGQRSRFKRAVGKPKSGSIGRLSICLCLAKSQRRALQSFTRIAIFR